mgnify:CR=1 FL=1
MAHLSRNSLVFTPGVVAETTTGFAFCVKLADGSTAKIQFGKDDDLVIMSGDGVDQYLIINNKNNRNTRHLYATPHALSLPAQPSNKARVWYGRMILPLSNALCPDHEIRFGELRHRMT